MAAEIQKGKNEEYQLVIKALKHWLLLNSTFTFHVLLHYGLCYGPPIQHSASLILYEGIYIKAYTQGLHGMSSSILFSLEVLLQENNTLPRSSSIKHHMQCLQLCYADQKGLSVPPYRLCAHGLDACMSLYHIQGLNLSLR